MFNGAIVLLSNCGNGMVLAVCMCAVNIKYENIPTTVEPSQNMFLAEKAGHRRFLIIADFSR